MEIKNIMKYNEILTQKSPGFPNGYCYDASILLENFEGIKSVSGYFMPFGEEQNKSA